MKNFVEFLIENSIVDYEGIAKNFSKEFAEKFKDIEPTHKCIKNWADDKSINKSRDNILFKEDIVNWNTNEEIITVLRGKFPGYQLYFEIEKRTSDKIEDYIIPLTDQELKTKTNNCTFGI